MMTLNKTRKNTNKKNKKFKKKMISDINLSHEITIIINLT